MAGLLLGGYYMEKELLRNKINNNLEHEYFEDGCIDGFFIPSMIRSSWAEQISILRHVADICERHNIKWYAACGTLLGAVRHNGFIPWDDDLDICMLQDDYLKFNEVVNEELPEGYKVLNIDREREYDNFLTRITNATSINTNIDYLDNHYGFPYVAGIDIFPLNYLYNDENKEKQRHDKLKKIYGIINEIKKNQLTYSQFELSMQIEKMTGFEMDTHIPVLSALSRILNKLFFECKNSDSTRVALMPFYAQYDNHVYKIDFYNKFLEMPFEYTTIRVPWQYENILAIDYGRWEIANQAGGIHDYPFFKEQENILKKHSGGKLDGRFYCDNINIDNLARTEHRNKCNQIINNINVLKKIANLIIKLICAKDSDSILELLNQCQDIAIKTGEEIESNYVDYDSVIVLLENYCEEIYNIYIKTEDNTIINQDVLVLDSLLNEIGDSIIKLKKKTKSILFLPYNFKYWYRFENIYKKYARESSYDIKVIPIPYYNKEFNGTVSEMIYDINKYPDYIHAIDFREFDFESNHFDEIYIQNPFDEYSRIMTVHPFFYSKNIRNYTDMLCYIPYFETCNIESSHEKSIANMKDYILAPGVIYSDKTILDNESSVNWYKKVLIESIANVYSDIELADYNGDIHMENAKKKILFYISPAMLGSDFDKTINKIKQSIAIFDDAQEKIEFFWVIDKMIHDYVKEDFMENSCEFWKIVEQYKNQNNCQICNAEIDFRDYDAYYGSPGYYLTKSVAAKLPAMVINVNI